ncbi:hypothetical protein E4U55_005655 [Claviceps digitariae]|nr:hypothetical protein E4U55_005655 [Claviceps digitariae]
MDKLTKGWVQHLRNTSRQVTPSQVSSPRNARCPLCDTGFEPNLDAFKAHVVSNSSKHPTLTGDSEIEEAFQNIILQEHDANKAAPVPGNAEDEDTAGDELDRLKLASEETASSNRGSKRLRSPPASMTQQRDSPPSTPNHSKAQHGSSIDEFDRGIRQRNQTARRLWIPDDDAKGNPAPTGSRTTQTKLSHGHSAPSSAANRGSSQQKPGWGSHHLVSNEPSWSPLRLQMPHQPRTRSITSDQLLAEVRGIYAGLVLLETKCIEYDTSLKTTALNNNQYHALISLHQSLLHEHHDFYLSSQHPSACEALQQIAAKYAMPARLWRHAIHSFLELLRCKLPASFEHLLAFIYVAYSMMALLTETVPRFKATWIECLGDLARYRMAVDGNGFGSRELWVGVAKYWYTQASDELPLHGRLYHHLAILARSNMLQQLYLYGKSLCVQIPFESTRESIMTLFQPLLDVNNTFNQRLDPVHAAFVRVHGILFSGNDMDQLQSSMDQFLESLDSRIDNERRDWIESGYCVGISLSCLLLGFGDKASVLMQALSNPRGDDVENEEPLRRDADAIASSKVTFDTATSFAEKTYDIVIRRWTDKNTLPFLHVSMAFYLFTSKRPAAMELVEDRFPWKLVSVRLNYLLKTCESPPRIDTTDFPGPEKQEPPHPLPEDYAMRGLIYTEDYFPQNWFDNDKIETDERYFEPPSTVLKRSERILWIGRMLARQEKWLIWDDATDLFTVAEKYDIDI